jgi:site-specific DNA recombinase
MVRAGIYARISSDREGDSLAISRQVADCEALAERRGWKVVERYVDSDISAYSGKLRPEYRRMLEEIEAGLIEAVVVYHADRLHRHPRELEEFMDACERAGLGNLATVSGDLDLASGDGQMMARVLGAFARKESDDKSRRIRRKHQELAQAGKVSGGGTRPFGFEADRRTIRPSEAAIIRECAERFLANEPLRSICRDLNARRIETVSGDAAWSSQTLRRILESARISGQREHHGEIVNKAEWEAIITPAQTQRIRAKLADPTRRKARTSRRYLLTRVLRCSHCNVRLYSRPREDRSRRYVCASGPGFGGCGKTTIVAEPLELFVVEAVLSRLDSPELAASLNGSMDDPDGAVWQAEIEQAEAQLAELAQLFGQQEISRQEWLAARPPIEQRLTVAKKRLAALNRTTALTPHIGNAADLRERWRGLSLTKQTQIVEAVLDHLVVGPGRPGFNRFDESRLTPYWRA